ncbi:MAG TPA: beta-ketoacyl synthase N-terminal-like domain-containing protein [Bacteroidales bacterium]|nr:beta-ketoacyl synthase N-terminal-like domain-containing protein [Bacteroidales bacterium]
MKPVFIASDNIISSLGFTSVENATNILRGQTGIKIHHNTQLAPKPFWASITDHARLENEFSRFAEPYDFTLFEKLVICSVKDALYNTGIDIQKENVLLILSTTKGNIDILDNKNSFHTDQKRVYLWNTADRIRSFFGLQNTPVVVSNACISGVLAVNIGARMIRSGRYEHVIVSGADLVTEFVLSGFNSFLSLCDGPCKPFDNERTGLSLGEAAGTIILTADKNLAGKDALIVRKGFSSNDANHISGPSRTGEGLYIAISKTLEPENPIDYISAHGTATPYNDEMESIALTRAGLNHVPVNSLKGYWGHTLGAAGIIEIAAGLYSMRNNVLFKTLGYSTPGTTQPIAVIDHNTNAEVYGFLKIASGFGGSNAALIITK